MGGSGPEIASKTLLLRTTCFKEMKRVNFERENRKTRKRKRSEEYVDSESGKEEKKEFRGFNGKLLKERYGISIFTRFYYEEERILG